jgi:ribose 5-phosphate isomerase B
MNIAIGSDHAGFAMKEELIPWLRELGHEVTDLGTRSAAPADYPDFAKTVGAEVAKARAERGILICGSGVGTCIAANKIKGIRASVCHDIFSARQGVEDDAMNVICLGARVIDIGLAKEVCTAFLAANFSNLDRHYRRLQKVLDLEKTGGV